MDKYFSNILQGLKREVSRGEIQNDPDVPLYAYVGAGLSMNAGLPSWFQMAKSLYEYIQQHERKALPAFSLCNETELSRFFQDFIEESSSVPGEDLPIISAYSTDKRLFGRTVALNLLFRCRYGAYEKTLNLEATNGFCRAGEEPQAEDLGIHSLLWRSGIHGALTTNYDMLLERAYSLFNHVGGLRTYRYNASFLRFVTSTPRFVVKIHGDVNDLGSMILDPQSAWDSKLYLNNSCGVAVKKLYANLRNQGPMIFVGLGFRDRTICELQNSWRRDRSQCGSGFAVFFKSEIDRTRKQWSRMGYADDLFDDVTFFIVDDTEMREQDIRGFAIHKAAINILERIGRLRRDCVQRPKWKEASEIHRLLYRNSLNNGGN